MAGWLNRLPDLNAASVAQESRLHSGQPTTFILVSTPRQPFESLRASGRGAERGATTVAEMHNPSNRIALK
jgi:hypothetical protein